MLLTRRGAWICLGAGVHRVAVVDIRDRVLGIALIIATVGGVRVGKVQLAGIVPLLTFRAEVVTRVTLVITGGQELGNTEGDTVA